MPKRSPLILLLVFTLCVADGVPLDASTAPAAPGSPCTPFEELRGAAIPQPAPGDVATVAQICVHGTSVASLDRVPYADQPGAPIAETRLMRDASIHPAVAIGTPDGAEIDIRSANGNLTHLFGGALWRAPAITQQGEIQALDRGHAQFSVAASLGYFGVVLPRFLARVRGTVFDVDFEKQNAAFSVSEGTVAVTRTVAIKLNDDNRVIDGIRYTDNITAGGSTSVSYKLPLGIERAFATQALAEQALQAQLRAAILNADPQSVDDAIYNIQVVSQHTIVGFIGSSSTVANASNAGSIGNTILAGLSAAGLGVAVRAAMMHGAAPTPMPTAPPTPMPTAPPTPMPTPTPVPTATPTPSPAPGNVGINEKPGEIRRGR